MPLAALARALGLVAALGLVLAAWGALRAELPEHGATALAADAFATAALLALLAWGVTGFSAEAPAARLGLRRGRLGAGASAL
ncbi:MAG TPA: hypothetical protein VLC53_00945, partial [Myxococcota bacterium]|nr:hypothetical protein [Myxococcota bacterium]